MKGKPTKRQLRKMLAEAERLRDEWAAEFTKARDGLQKLQRTVEKAIEEISK